MTKDRIKELALVITEMRIQVPQKAWNFTTNWVNVSFSKKILFSVVITT